ncbi:hypothetical protein HSR122_1362 [Halapricum desulfuricans]|uniref:Uncharacterized protein n=1 Tax=Halapricum desulfuricans TaxID=2841257 RepID=A0A897NCR0_9EURY|nr:hypothetical protein HSR122_1362 [Halapricum desulfuricans]
MVPLPPTVRLAHRYAGARLSSSSGERTEMILDEPFLGGFKQFD